MSNENQGLAYLLKATKGSGDSISPRCVKIKVLLDGKEYYVPVGDMKDVYPVPTPPFPIHMAVAYSEIRDAKLEFVGVQKHSDLTIFGTGCVGEIVDHPSWWTKRDSNGI